ncbi:MAG: PAS domain S-box protein [Fibrobacteria bacterium]|nr:PAS domain S-box protein [Fibrobacteria bacterium]
MVKNRTLLFQIIVVVILLVSYIGFGVYMNMVQHINIVFSHLAYIPITLAGLWWGKKSLIIAAFLSIVLLIFHVVGFGAGETLWDLTRSLIFITVAFCIGILSDHIKKNKDALSISEEKYRTLIEKSLTGIYVYREEKVVFANSRFCNMLGYSLEDLVGTPAWDFIYKPDREKVKTIIESRKSSKLSDAFYEIRLLDKKDNIIWVDVSSSYTIFEGTPAIIVNLYDISEKKETERKEKELSELTKVQEEQLVHSTRLAELGEMAAGIAHEINQPLTGIKNFAKNTQYMLENKIGSSEEISENLRLISEQVDRTAKIISQMRELTRKSEKKLEPVNINAVIVECVEFLHPQLKLSGIKVICQLKPDLPVVLGDRIRLSQVFLNIIANAKQAMEEEETRELNIDSFFEKESIKVTISDMGRGFNPEDRDKIFHPFYTTKKAGQGTGLGLSISLSIIKDHNGEILATGKPGLGAVFEVHLPVVNIGKAS